MKLVSFGRLCARKATAGRRFARDPAMALATGATSTASWRSVTLLKVNKEDDGEKIWRFGPTAVV
jgi:hypothetical protein